MENTLLLAQFFGLFSIILSIAVIVRQRMIVHILENFLTNRPLAFIVGVFEMAAGLFLILNHNIWTTALASVVTIMGWLILLEGVFYTFVRMSTMQRLIGMLHRTKLFYLFAIAYLVLGIYLVYAGFSG